MNLKLKKGLTLNIAGALPQDARLQKVNTSLCAIVPDDFPGFIPKLCVKEGDAVNIGTPILYNKADEALKITSPIAGTVKAIVRGERRKILRIEIEAGPTQAPKPAFEKNDTIGMLAQSGLLALLRQRPFDIVVDTHTTVRDIFITAYDPAPLAPSPVVFDAIFTADDYRAGVAALAKLTEGKVYLCHGADWKAGNIAGAEMVTVQGPFPAGNAGVQIANIAPVNKGETVWTLDLPTLGRIGRLTGKGELCWDTIVAVTGPEVAKPALRQTIIGSAIAPLIDGCLDSAEHHRRIISGNVLVGQAIGFDGFLRFPYRQITVIAEGDDKNEFMGWASFSPGKMSESRTFPGHFLNRLFRPDARLNGGRRAMIMSGEYDKMMPMDILPEYLLKAILSDNIEDMEKLGIYEVAPEDFAAAEYADTSKLPLQQIVRDGLNKLRKELM